MIEENPIHDQYIEEPTIKIKGHRFWPEQLVVPAGVVVKVVNDEPDDHTITADGGEFDEDVSGGNEAEVVAPPPGEYPFHCKIHPEMKGLLVVQSLAKEREE